VRIGDSTFDATPTDAFYGIGAAAEPKRFPACP